MDAKLADFSEIGNILSVKSDINNGCAALFGRFGLGDLLRHLPLEKVSGVSPVMLIVSLCLFRINGTSIYRAYKARFSDLLKTATEILF